MKKFGKKTSSTKMSSTQATIKSESSINLSDLFWEGQMKKGDLIFSKGKSKNNNSFPYGYWGHVGFAYDDDQAYESHPKTEILVSQDQNGGVGKRFYEKWQEAYNYMAVAKYKYSYEKGYQDTSTVVEYAKNAYGGQSYPLKSEFLDVLFNVDGFRYKDKGIVCSQLVTLAFEEAPGWGVIVDPAGELCGGMFVFPDDIYFGRQYIGYDSPMNFEVVAIDSGATPQE